uniref:VWFA domain-containing protein n=1 Tax=Amphilophus citrinellus TaxID=61819 RepID=A0A3Q0SFX1_AMPCI
MLSSAAGFGYQVVQRQSDLLVSAPLEQYSQNGRGKIYRCSTSAQNSPDFAVNMSLGLTMKSDPTSQRTVVCGPTIPKDCNINTMYDGVCFQLDHSNKFGPPIPSSLQECQTQADIAFLLDGSGSVSGTDFQTMKTFVKNLIRSFLSSDTQFSVTQFSRSPQVHFYFRKFSSSGSMETTIDGIDQQRQTAYTAKAIRHVVENVFTSQRGSRPNVKKVLIVITDGESHDRTDLGRAIKVELFGCDNTHHVWRSKVEFVVLSVFSLYVTGSQSGGESLKMEMSQEGFSAAFVPEGIQMSIVGANQWKGGYMQYSTKGQKVKTYEDMPLENKESKSIEPFSSQYQTGEYFGAEVCAMDINNDDITDLIFISAPMHLEPDGEGRVYVCRLTGLVDFSFTRSSEVKVGIDELLDVTVTVENRGENSYNSRVILTYPAGLSYRKFTIQQGRIECSSLDSEDGLSRGSTDCSIKKLIFKSKTKASFIVSYGIETNSQLQKKIFVTANATSGNQEHAATSELYKKKSIDVKDSIFMTVINSFSYNSFTSGRNNLQKPFQQSITITNDIRALNFTVVIRVPVKLGEKDIWVDLNSLQIAECQGDNDEEPLEKDFVAQILKNKVVDCSVARCRVFKCNTLMGIRESRMYEISANLSSGWIEQIGLQSAKFLLTSTASLEYDKNQYIYFSTGSNIILPVHKIEAEVEVYPERNFTKEIVGGSMGGLVFVALLTAGLYKAGFFKSKYKQMMKESRRRRPRPDPDEGASPAE